MPEGSTISASNLFSDDAGELLTDAGVPRYNRRLTDKILAAFNHAYAMGELDLAQALWECLVAAEKLGQNHQRRRYGQALDLAADWAAFVDARDRLRELGEVTNVEADDAAEAFRAMRQAYEAWKAHNAGEYSPPAAAPTKDPAEG